MTALDQTLRGRWSAELSCLPVLGVEAYEKKDGVGCTALGGAWAMAKN